jgi:hypothetical protein
VLGRCAAHLARLGVVRGPRRLSAQPTGTVRASARTRGAATAPASAMAAISR